MSDNVHVVEKIEVDTQFVLRVGEGLLYLNEHDATKLRDELNRFLKIYADFTSVVGQPQWSVGDIIPENSEEPDLPIGSRLEDDSEYKDVLEKVEGGWGWRKCLDSWNPNSLAVEAWGYTGVDFNFKVLRIGDSN